MELSVRQIPSIRLACLKHNGKLVELRETWDRLTGWASRTGVLGRGPLVAVTAGAPAPGATCKYLVGVGVGKDVDVDDPIEIATTTPGLYAVALAQGKENVVPDLYKKLEGDWIEKNGCARRAGDCLEFRLNSPRQVGESDLLIEVCIPVDRVAPEEPEEGGKDRLAAMMRGEFEEELLEEEPETEEAAAEEEAEAPEAEPEEAPARGKKAAAEAAKGGKAGAAAARKKAAPEKASAKAEEPPKAKEASKAKPAKAEPAVHAAKVTKSRKTAKADKPPATTAKAARAAKPVKAAAKPTKPAKAKPAAKAKGKKK